MSDSDEVRIEAALAATDEVRLLIGELEAVLAAEYPPSSAMDWRSTRSSSRTSGSFSHDGKAPR